MTNNMDERPDPMMPLQPAKDKAAATVPPLGRIRVPGLPPLRPNVPLIYQIENPPAHLPCFIREPRSCQLFCIGCRCAFPAGGSFDRHARECELLKKLRKKVTQPKENSSISAERHPLDKTEAQYLVDYRARMVSKHGAEWTCAKIDESRFPLIETMRPSRCHLGTDEWDGCVVFEFPWTRKVILESGTKNHAAYIISGNWREVMSRGRSVIRTVLPHEVHRIRHHREWFRDVKDILGFKRRFALFLQQNGSTRFEHTPMAVETLHITSASGVTPPQKVRPKAAQLNPAGALKGVTIRRIPFEVLPPGAWDIEYLIDRCRRAMKTTKSSSQGPVLEVQRLRKLVKLHPSTCHVGTEEWKGYVVLEFPNSRRVVLECPYAGNATYVLSGKWQRQLRHTKLYIRAKCPAFRGRFFHRGDWLARIREALQIKDVNTLQSN